MWPPSDPPARVDAVLVLAGGKREGIRVACLRSPASSTRGEARAFAELAGREGWRSVAVVTSSYHARRASLLVDRCYEGTVHPVAAGSGPTGGWTHEVGAARECRPARPADRAAGC